MLDYQTYSIRRMEIKTCPFCGSKAELMVIPDDSDYCFDRKTGKQIEYYDVKCTDTDCYLGYGASWNHRRSEEAIELWNKRSKQKERAERLDQLGV